MVVFCPNCGTQNAGLAGARATCTACQSTFDVPADAARPPVPAAAPPPPAATGYSAPGAQVFSPPSGAAPIRQTTGSKTNLLAVVSLVAGVVCCVPLVSPGVALVCGIGAIKQIDARGETGRGLAIAGIILGAITALMQFFWLIGVISRGRF